MQPEVITPLTQVIEDGVIDRDDLRQFMMRSNRPAFLKILAHMLVFAATTYLINLSIGSIWVVFPMFVHGVCLAHLFSLQHECAHYTVFRTRWINDVVGRFCGLVGFIPHGFFRYEHCDHHTFTHLKNKDPELIELPESLSRYIFYISGFTHWQAMASVMIRLSAGRLSNVEKRFIPKVARSSVIREIRWMLLFYLVVFVSMLAIGWSAPLWYWIIPSIMGQPVMRFIRMTEHVGRPNVSAMRENTRTTYVGFIWRFLCWNMNYHAEHHYVPSTPFHKLPDLHQRLKDHVYVVKGGYSAAHRDIVSQIVANSKNTETRVTKEPEQ